jgi:hypothetical protein
MSHFPWRIRMILSAVVSALAGAYATDAHVGTGADEASAGAVILAAILTILGCIVNGESKTTPMSEPVGNDGLPMLSWQEAQAMHGAAAQQDPTAEEIEELLALLGGEGDDDHEGSESSEG